MKTRSTFFRDEMVRKIRNNAQGSDMKRKILENAEKWVQASDDQLWESIFSYELKRSQMVLSYGWCPACKKTIEMHRWKYDAFHMPWKVVCPACNEVFPKNDFKKYYLSGLDKHHVFRPELADRSLLYNEEAPDPNDEKHLFGVDDGNGYHEGKHRWMFIGTYLKWGGWEQYIYDGIRFLAWAYLLTGEVKYARKCGILLDRLADLFPEYDFNAQGVIYEEEHTSRGYISYWCDSADQIREMALAYDAVFEALQADPEFISFVLDKSEKYETPYRKHNFTDIRRNIENRIFSDAISKKWKIASNYPWTDEAITISKMVLVDWAKHPDDITKGVHNVKWWCVEDDMKLIIQNITRADGLSGEKGMEGYSTFALSEGGRIISLFNMYDPEIFRKTIEKYPRYLQGIRFFINAWLLNAYYPGCGDCGYLSAPNRGIPFPPGYTLHEANARDSTILFSFEGFMWKLYELTGDVNLVRFIYNAKNYDINKCFSADFSLDDTPENIRRKMIALMKEKGSGLRQESENHETWKLTVMHSGEGDDRRCAYLDYDSGGVHGHNDGMNIGIYAKGMNLLPDFGYPPAHRPGGWSSKFFCWYRSAASHNTVIVDGKEHRDFCYVQRDVNGGQGYICESGNTVLWGVGQWVKTIAVDNPLIANVQRFERTFAMVDVTPKDGYYFDVFRVKGGTEHVKLVRASVCKLELANLNRVRYTPEVDPYGMGFIRDKNETQNFHYETDADFQFVRNMQIDTNPPREWTAEWKYLNRYEGYLIPAGKKDMRLKYRDMTDDIQVISYDAFFCSNHAVRGCYPEEIKNNEGFPEEMLPGVAIVRKGDAPLVSTFIGVYEPCEGDAFIHSVKKLQVLDRNTGEHRKEDAAVEIRCKNGCTDLLLFADLQNRGTVYQPEWDVETDAAACIVRKQDHGGYKVCLLKGSWIRCGQWKAQLEGPADLYETEMNG